MTMYVLYDMLVSLTVLVFSVGINCALYICRTCNRLMMRAVTSHPPLLQTHHRTLLAPENTDIISLTAAAISRRQVPLTNMP